MSVCFGGLQPERLTVADEEINAAVNTPPAWPVWSKDIKLHYGSLARV